MIPQKLQIKNFLSYGPEIQTIDFASYPLICLSGKNGHGKSALLDAITWALWGQARKISNTAKADQGLLHLGQSIMMVSLDFECNGQRYRIKREYAQTYGKPYALLEFGILTDDGAIIPLTDKTIRATQHKIEQTLHLDFDAFTNSAFLRQGQSNEFSKKSPKDRKEILASILGLNRYEKIKKLALEKSKQAHAHKNSLITLEQKYHADLQTGMNIHEQLAVLIEELDQVTIKELHITKEQAKLTDKRLALSNRQNEAQVLEIKIKHLRDNQGELRNKLRALRTLWRSVNKQHAQMSSLDDIEQMKQNISARLTQHQREIQRLLHIKEELLQEKAAMSEFEHKARSLQEQKLHQLKIELNNLNHQQADLLKNINDQKMHNNQWTLEKKTFEKNKEIVGIELLKITAELVDQKQLEKQFERRKEYYHRFIADGNALKKELEELEQKKQLAHREDDPSCPLCEQNLSASRKRFLKNKFEDRGRFITLRCARLSKLIRRLKELLIEQHAHIELNRKNHEAINLLHLKLEEIEKSIYKANDEIEKSSAKLLAHESHSRILQTAIQKLNQEIAQTAIFDQKKLLLDPEYQKLHEQFMIKENETKQLAQHTSQQQLLLAQLDAIEKQIVDLQRVKELIAQQGQRKQEILGLCLQLKQLKHELITLEQQNQQYANIVHEEAELGALQQQIDIERNALKLQKEEKFQQKGRIEAQKALLQNLEKEYREIQKSISELSGQIEEYQTIAQATGKDGIQALLIEDAIPEIEQEANNLLSKLTDNQAHIYIESLRDLKKGGTKETLDIKISDAIGIRPYELFSGGEAFRIDFALRIAISKLLARRAGTALQTLIIDEGFGSQDEEGLQHIMEAIYKIQEDFAKVIIVSHLPTMKDQFPVHFVIDKGAHGSQIKVVEQG